MLPRGKVPARVLVLAAIAAIIAPDVSSQSQSVDITATLVGVIGLIAAIALLKDRPPDVPPMRLTFAWGAFLAWAFVSALASGRFWASMVGEPTSMLGWLLLLAMTALVMAASRYGPEARRLLDRYAWLVVLAELGWVAYGQVVASPMSAGTFFNSTYLGEGLLLLLPWTLPTAEARVGERWARFGTIALAIIALPATRSRVAGVLALAWVAWAVARRVRARTAHKLAALGALMAGVVLVATLASGPSGVLGSAGDLVLGGRLSMLKEGALAVGQRPATGWGPDGFFSARAAVRTEAMATAGEATLLVPGAMDPHNFLALVAVSTGIVGLALFVWFALETVGVWRCRVRSGIDAAPAIWALGACLVVGLTAPVTLHVWPLLALMIGISLSQPTTPHPAKRSASSLVARRRWRRAGGAALAFTALTSAVMALNAATRATLEVSGEEISPGLAAQSVVASSVWRLDAHVAYLTSLHTGWAAPTVPSYAMDRIDLASIERAVSLDKHFPEYALKLAGTRRYYNEPAERVDAAFAEAFRRYPIYPLAHAEYALYLATNGRIDKAREHLRIARLVDDHDPGRLSAIEQAESIIAAGGG